MANKQIKSRKRVQERGEVFTSEREVKAMCDLIDCETKRIDSRFLEPACGDGNFLAEILERKLKIVKQKYRKSFIDYEKMSLLAVSSLYGIDIMEDNVKACRKRLFCIWNKVYTGCFKDQCLDETRGSVQAILRRNIVCGNALSLMVVDESGNDKNEPIVFSEWAFVTGMIISRKDYTLDELVNNESQLRLGPKQGEGRLLQQLTTNYRRID